MIREKCEREPLVAAATRSGIWPGDLESHVAACPGCAETKRVAQLFVQHAATTSAQNHPPAANIVWHRLQAQRQQLALKRATRCMALMRILAALYAVALGAWWLPQLWHLQSAQFSTAFSVLSSGILTGVVTAVVAVVLGSCCLVLLGSRTTFRLHT